MSRCSSGSDCWAGWAGSTSGPASPRTTPWTSWNAISATTGPNLLQKQQPVRRSCCCGSRSSARSGRSRSSKASANPIWPAGSGTTRRPSSPGNFALAGHRVTHGSLFKKLLDLTKGDQVIVETADAVYTYEMDTSPRDLTLKPKDNWVLNRSPANPAKPRPDRSSPSPPARTCSTPRTAPSASATWSRSTAKPDGGVTHSAEGLAPENLR